MLICFLPVAAEKLEGQMQPPEVVKQLEDVHVQDGSMARFECSVTGNPRPGITWFRESSKLTPSEDFRMFYDDDNQCALVIKEIFPEDTGHYTMVAKNVGGTASSSADLFVEGK